LHPILNENRIAEMMAFVNVHITTSLGVVELSLPPSASFGQVKKHFSEKTTSTISLLLHDGESLGDDTRLSSKVGNDGCVLFLEAFVEGGKKMPKKKELFLFIVKRMKANEPGLTEVNIEGQELTAEDASLLSDALLQNSNVKTLLCSNNLLGDDGARHIAQGLANNSSLESLFLDRNNIGDGGCEALAKVLEGKKNLVNLSLEHNVITSRGSQVLADVLSRTGLNYLVLDRNAMCEDLKNLLRDFLVVKKDERLGEHLFAAVTREDLVTLGQEQVFFFFFFFCIIFSPLFLSTEVL
jgi:hypothetical protein